jgi:putative tryptophan/tyrosine transport system substrate-binding protein
MAVRTRRREFVVTLGSAVAWPLAARAQQPGKTYRIGFLANDPAIPTQPAGQAFLDVLRESGFIEGKNVIIDRRFTGGRPEQYDPLVAELAQLRPDVLVTSANEATLAAKRANIAMPIVMMSVSDPVGQGIVASLASPGGNITGVIQDDTAEILAKRMQLLKDAVPHAAKVAVLFNPDEPYERSQWQQLEVAARSLKVTLRQLVARRVSEIEGAFASIGSDRPDVLLLPISSFDFANRKLIIELALKNGLPAMSPFKEATEIGGLMSYGSVRVDRFRDAAIYVSKILKGAKPADLPVELPTKYELVVNLKTARSLNLEIPRDLLLVADDVIE